MEKMLFGNEEKNVFEYELKARGCVELIRGYTMNESKEATEIVENILNVLFNYYICIGNNYYDEEMTIEEKIEYLYYERIIDEDTRDKWLYLCEVINNLYKMDENKKI